MASYCVKCRAKRGDVSLQPAVTKNGRPTIKSQCRASGKRKLSFLSKAQIQGGSFGSLFAPLLGKVSAPVTKEVAQRLLPALGMAAVTGAISGATHKAAAE